MAVFEREASIATWSASGSSAFEVEAPAREAFEMENAKSIDAELISDTGDSPGTPESPRKMSFEQEPGETSTFEASPRSGSKERKSDKKDEKAAKTKASKENKKAAKANCLEGPHANNSCVSCFRSPTACCRPSTRTPGMFLTIRPAFRLDIFAINVLSSSPRFREAAS